MKHSVPLHNTHQVGLFVATTLLVVAWYLLLQAMSPVVQASGRPGYGHEAEYNATARWERNQELYVPFVTSDPAWGWLTTVTVQNTEPNTATIALHYLDTDGAASIVEDELPAMGSRAYTPAGTFSGSLWITATQRIAAVAIDRSIDPGWNGDGLMSYRAVPCYSWITEIGLMPIYRAHEGWNSTFAIQNLDATAAPITVTFYALNGTPLASFNDNLPPHSAHLYDATALSALAGHSFTRAHVESPNPLAGAVKATNAQTGEAVAHNNRGLSPSGRLRSIPTSLYLPLVLRHNTSTLVAYNLTSEPSHITATLYYEDGNSVATYTHELAPLASHAFSLADGAWSSAVPIGFRGSGLVEFSHEVGVLVETTWPPMPHTFTGYSGAMLGVDNAMYVPLVSNAADGPLTQISVQNAAFGEKDVQVTVDYYDEAGNLAGTETAHIALYAAHYFDQSSSGLPVPFRSSAVVTADDAITVIVTVSEGRVEEFEETPIDLEAGATLVYVDEQGLTTQVDVPPGAAAMTSTLTYLPLVSPVHPLPAALPIAGHAFALEVYQDGVFYPDLAFSRPITITLQYSEADMAGMDESLLALYHWSGSQWLDAAMTCALPSAYDRHPDENWLAVPICRTGEFALVGEGYWTVYLPLVLRLHTP